MSKGGSFVDRDAITSRITRELKVLLRDRLLTYAQKIYTRWKKKRKKRTGGRRSEKPSHLQIKGMSVLKNLYTAIVIPKFSYFPILIADSH